MAWLWRADNGSVGRGAGRSNVLRWTSMVLVGASIVGAAGLGVPTPSAAQDILGDPLAQPGATDPSATDPGVLADLAAAEELRAMQRAAALEALNASRDALHDAQGSLSEAEAAAERAEDATASAEEAVRIRRAALGGVAVDAFVNAGTTGAGSFDDSRGSGWHSKLMGELSGAAVDGAQERLEAAEADRERLAVAGEAAQDRIAEATAAVADAEVLVHDAEDELAQVTAAGDVAVALAQLGGDGDLTDGVTVLGDSAVSAQQMADFVVSRGSPDDSIDMVELAGIFLEEGAAEGVRGDIAFTQSILETGWFSFRNSMVDVADNNYSGIGACDSCSNGYWYESPRDGVRAQMQLLHTYADAELVSATLAHPPVRSAPERISVRGCCDTWSELTGVWATADGYGTRILELYADMLRFAGSA